MKTTKIIRLEAPRHPQMTAYLHEDQQLRPAILILPGGSYYHLVQHEQEPVAERFFPMGYQCFVVNRYAVSRESVRLQPLEDVARLMAHLRQHAADYHVDPHAVYTLGFSAGGHLAALLGNHWKDEAFLRALNLQAEDVEPNAQVLAYPFLSYDGFEKTVKEAREKLEQKSILFRMLFRPCQNPEKRAKQGFPALLSLSERRWTVLYSLLRLACIDLKFKFGLNLMENLPEMDIPGTLQPFTPPTFLWHSREDAMVPFIQSEIMAQKLEETGIPHALHLYEKGAHGTSVQAQGLPSDSWPEEVHQWLRLLSNTASGN